MEVKHQPGKHQSEFDTQNPQKKLGMRVHTAVLVLRRQRQADVWALLALWTSLLGKFRLVRDLVS